MPPHATLLSWLYTEVELLDEILKNAWRVFLPAIRVTSTALPWDLYFLKFTQPLTVSSTVTEHSKWERRKTWKKTKRPSLYFKRSTQKPQFWELEIMPRNLNKIVRVWIRLLFSMPFSLPTLQHTIPDMYKYVSRHYIKGTVSRDFWLWFFFMNHLYPDITVEALNSVL